MDMIKHSQSTKSSKFAISLQDLKKKIRNGVHYLYADKHQSFYKLGLSFLIEVARHVQSTQNRILVIFFQYIKKKERNCFYVLMASKHSNNLPVPIMVFVAFGWLWSKIGIAF